MKPPESNSRTLSNFKRDSPEGIHLFLFDVYAVRYGSFELHAANPDVALQEFELREGFVAQMA